MEHTADALFIYDPEGRIFDVNRRSRDTLGYTREELLSLSLTDLETVLFSIGVTIRVSLGDRPRGLLRDADLAMYPAKEKGKNRCEIYHPGTSARG